MHFETRKGRVTSVAATTLLCLSLGLLPGTAHCQADFVPIPADVSAKYHIDFERNYFPSPDAEKAERVPFRARLTALENWKGKLASSPEALLRELRLYDQALVELKHHDTYLFLRHSVNDLDSASASDRSDMMGDFSKRTAFVQEELMQISEAKLEKFIRQKPELQVYRYTIESSRRFQPYSLSLEEEETFSVIAPLATEWQNDLHRTLLQRTDYGMVQSKDGPLDLRKQRSAVVNSADPAVRAAGSKGISAAFDSQRELHAFVLTSLAKANNRLAKLHHFEDAPSQIFFNSYWSKADVTTLLREVEKNAQVYKRYQRLRAEQAKLRLGILEVNAWDVNATPKAASVPRFDIAQASDVIRAALGPLGPEYGKQLAELLDPANGRMDIVAGPHRKGGGFSKGFPGVRTAFFSNEFNGYYNDMRVLTHESTHAIHRQLMIDNQVLPAYAEGPHYLFESFAIFNEFLLPDYLYQHETDPAKRRYYLEQFFEGKGMTLFTAAQDEAVEIAIYDRVQANPATNADELDALTKSISVRYSIWADKSDAIKNRWITDSLFYEDPLYDVNYVYGAILALKYYDLYLRNPKDFMPRYITMLKNGFDAPPGTLLKRHLDIDLNDPALVKDAVRLLEKKVDQLEVEYAAQSTIVAVKTPMPPPRAVTP